MISKSKIQFILKLPGKKMIPVFIVTVTLVAIFLASPWLLFSFRRATIQLSSKWSAVYMANGDIFIGKIGVTDSSTVELDNAYFLEAKKSEDAENKNRNSGLRLEGVISNISLVKWGFFQPLKSPGKIFVSRPAILFWEFLDNDSEIVTRIGKMNKKQ